MLSTPVRSRTSRPPRSDRVEQRLPGRAVRRRSGPAISSCPNFSASVILPISEVTWLSIDASRCLVAAETPVVGCWAEARAARLPEPAARVLTDPVVAAARRPAPPPRTR